MKTREEAMERWNAMSFELQQIIVQKDWVFKERVPLSLTGREIEEIFKRVDERNKVLD